MRLLNNLFSFVMYTSKMNGIDESHGLSHSMDVLYYAKEIFENEKHNYKDLIKHERIIYVSAIVHDMCDKKYMNEMEGLKNIEDFLREKKVPNEEIDVIKKIVSTMSYSKVKKDGFPELKEYQSAYHIVRESDLLSAYNFDRAMIYSMNVHGSNTVKAFLDSEKLFHSRMFKHIDDDLFVTETGKKIAETLEVSATKRIDHWNEILKY